MQKDIKDNEVEIEIPQTPTQKPIFVSEAQTETEILYQDKKLTIGRLNELSFSIKKSDSSSLIAPVGLMGFGLTTFLLNLENAGVYHLSPVVLGMGVVYGGLAQFVAGVLEWVKGNNFTAITFMSFGAFWWSFVLISAIPVFGWCGKANDMDLACYLFVWLIFTLVMTVASFTKPWSIRITFLLVDLLLILLAAGHWGPSKNCTKAGGIAGVIAAIFAMYVGAAEIINDAWKRTIFPLGAPGEKCWGKVMH